MGEYLSDGILVSAIQGCVLTTLLSALVKTFELVHGTVIISVHKKRKTPIISGHTSTSFSPYPACLLLFLLVQLVDIGECPSIVVAPEHRVAVVAGTNDAVLCQPLAAQVRQVAMVDSHNPVGQGECKQC